MAGDDEIGTEWEAGEEGWRSEVREEEGQSAK
jgi:hypothetical protein